MARSSGNKGGKETISPPKLKLLSREAKKLPKKTRRLVGY